MDIREHIERHGLSRQEIRDHVGISQPYLSLIERGLRPVGLPIVAKMAEALGVEISDLRPDIPQPKIENEKASAA